MAVAPTLQLNYYTNVYAGHLQGTSTCRFSLALALASKLPL